VLLFDEPLSNLDAKLRRQVREDIRAIQKDLGLTVVYVTHDQEEALAVSDQIVVMRNAAIAQMGTPRELYEAPNDRFVADFIGEANLIACQIVAVNNDLATVEIEGFQYTLPSRGLPPGPATLAVRPSRLRIGDDEGIHATVSKATYVGVRMEYTLDGAFGQVFAVQEDVDEPLEVGREVRMSFAGKGPVLLPED
jgi:iron(III) transport system ATP-binding protein